MTPLPIRRRFALWTAALVGLVVAVFSGGTLYNLHDEQIEKVDLELDSVARHIRGLDERAVAQRSPEELVGFEPWLSAAIFDRDGTVVRRMAALPEPVAREALAHSGTDTMRAAGGGWRMRALPLGDRVVVIAHSLEEVNMIVQDLLLAYALSLPLVLLLAAVGGWWVAGRALAGLREFTVAAETIGAGQLHRRLPVPPVNDEIRRLAEVLNAMLARLQTSFEQSQRFAADASHELRTPLTIIAGEVERLLRAPELPRSAEDKLLSLQEEINRLQRIAEQMLLLAKFDAGTTGAAHAELDLSELVHAACEDAELLAPAHELSIASDIAPAIRVQGDRLHLRQLVLNLLDNATRYNERHGKVHCTLKATGGVVHLRVGNTGPGIPAAARGQLFQRFFRTDAARSRGGHGLGLSLCREIARSHGGEIELAPASAPAWTDFVVTLPLPAKTRP